jgi:hypothetical protein
VIGIGSSFGTRLPERAIKLFASAVFVASARCSWLVRHHQRSPPLRMERWREEAADYPTVTVPVMEEWMAQW